MCFNCYHARGRSKPATHCEHKDRACYSLGLCKCCYLTQYHQSRRQKMSLLKSKERPESRLAALKKLSLEMQDIFGRPASPKRQNEYKCYVSPTEEISSNFRPYLSKPTGRCYSIISVIESTTISDYSQDFAPPQYRRLEPIQKMWAATRY